ncbi:MAG: site-specific integrase [Hyphomicrobiales bacterium]|nr:MAG: site-specific integrase [Hyphomicrobiales bacterium]
MPTTNRLTAKQVAAIKAPGNYTDGDGLILRVASNGDKRWTYRYVDATGKRRDYSIGNAAKVSLADARTEASRVRDQRKQGLDPIRARGEVRIALTELVPEIPTFGEFADSFINDIAGGFANSKHVAQWRMTLGDKYCRSLRVLPVDQITSAHVLEVLRLIWTTKNETASRLRGRIEQVLKAAKIAGYRSGENPASRDNILPALPRIRRQAEHHAALPYAEIADFLAALVEREGTGALALQFLILTAARSGEVRGATWSEFDLEAGLWIIPGARMKAKREHRVPLAPGALALLRTRGKGKPDELVFPGMKEGKPMSDMTLAKVLKRMGLDVTPHGFRSTFRDWVYEETDTAREVAEAALAHAVGDATEKAYRRGDALEKRRKLMQEWESFCFGALKASNDAHRAAA